MADKKSDDQFEEGFEEDFNFGEDEFGGGTEGGETPPPSKSSSKPKTGLLMIVGVVALGLVGYSGWRFYSKAKAAQSTPSKTTQEIAAAGTNTTGTNATTPSPTTEPTSPSADLMALQKKPEPFQQPGTGVKNAAGKSEDFNLNEITSGFEGNNNAPNVPTNTPPLTTPPPGASTTAATAPGATPSKQVSIQELQKTLFPETGIAPEKNVPPPKDLAAEKIQQNLFPETIQKNQPAASTTTVPDFGVSVSQTPVSQVPVPSTPGPTGSMTPSPGTISTHGAVTATLSPEIQAQLQDTLKNLNRLNNQMDFVLSQLKQLDAYTQAMTTNMTKLSNEFNNIDNRILALTNTTSTLSKDIVALKVEEAQPKKVAIKSVKSEYAGLEEDETETVVRRRRPRTICQEDSDLEYETVLRRRKGICQEEPEYVVHAVIPGRAWLKSSKGQIITVTEGESVGDYGKVLVIDAANSVVLTNSGITFR